MHILASLNYNVMNLCIYYIVPFNRPGNYVLVANYRKLHDMIIKSQQMIGSISTLSLYDVELISLIHVVSASNFTRE